MFELLACKIVVGKEEIYDYKQFYKTYNFRFNFLREREENMAVFLMNVSKIHILINIYNLECYSYLHKYTASYLTIFKINTQNYYQFHIK